MTAETEYIDFVQLTAFPEFEISTSHPFVIRNISSGRILKQNINSQGYLTVQLGTSIPIHRIIAEQFNNPNIQVINHQRLVENLGVVDNNKNTKTFIKQVPEYIPQDEINKDNLIQLEKYKDKDFNKYYFDKSNDKLYIYQDKLKRYKTVKPTKSGKYFIVSLIQTNKHTITSLYDKVINYCKNL